MHDYSLWGKDIIVISELWTVARTAKHLDVSKKRVYQMIAIGKIDALKLSARNTRVTRDSVDRFLNAQLEHKKQELGLDMGPLPPRRGCA